MCFIPACVEMQKQQLDILRELRAETISWRTTAVCSDCAQQPEVLSPHSTFCLAPFSFAHLYNLIYLTCPFLQLSCPLSPSLPLSIS